MLDTTLVTCGECGKQFEFSTEALECFPDCKPVCYPCAVPILAAEDAERVRRTEVLLEEVTRDA